MLPDLDRLIRLQELENAVERARGVIVAMPAKLAGLDARIAAESDALAAAKQRLADSQAARRTLEKDVAAVQSRLSKFKDQLMEVKTNKEYQAMQKEIAAAEHEVRSFEDKILEKLLEADELQAAVKQAEAELAAEQKAAAAERRALEEEHAALEREIAGATDARAWLVAELNPGLLGLFEHVSRQRKGVAVVEARDGHCTLCNVRLRPQVFNDIRRNDSIIQCESCHRILYFASSAVADPQNP